MTEVCYSLRLISKKTERFLYQRIGQLYILNRNYNETSRKLHKKIRLRWENREEPRGGEPK